MIRQHAPAIRAAIKSSLAAAGIFAAAFGQALNSRLRGGKV